MRQGPVWEDIPLDVLIFSLWLPTSKEQLCQKGTLPTRLVQGDWETVEPRVPTGIPGLPLCHLHSCYSPEYYLPPSVCQALRTHMSASQTGASSLIAVILLSGKCWIPTHKTQNPNPGQSETGRGLRGLGGNRRPVFSLCRGWLPSTLR